MSKVVVKKCSDYYDAKIYISESFNLLGGIQKYIKYNDKVLIKPNLCDPLLPEKAATTNPILIKAIVELVHEAGGIAYIGEGSGGNVNGATKKAFEVCGVNEIAKQTGAIIVNFQEEEWVTESIKDYMYVKDTEIPKSILDIDCIINVPKLKTHGLTVMTGAVKNVFGCISSNSREFIHRHFKDSKRFANAILDVYSLIKPSITIMDAIVAMEGDKGPIYGEPKELGYIITGEDGVSVDAVASFIMGHKEGDIPIISLSNLRRIGISNLKQIEIIGDECMINKEFKRSSLVQHDNTHGNGGEVIFVPEITDSCTQCNSCYTSCPVEAINKIENGKLSINKNKCIECLCCQEVCINDSIQLKKQDKSEIYGDGTDIIRLGEVCNHNCVFCVSYTGNQREMEIQEVKKHIDFLAENGCGKLAFTGGEPTLRQDIFEILRYGKSKGIKIDLQTNGVLLKDMTFAKKLIGSGVDHFFVSLHSHDNDTFRRITLTDTFYDVIQGIKNLKELNSSVQISHVMNALNYKNIEEFVRFVHEELQVKMIYFGFINPNSCLNNGCDIVPRLSDVQEYLYKAFKYCENSNIQIDVEGIPMCYLKGFYNHNIEWKRLHWSPKYHIEKDIFREDTHYLNLKEYKSESELCSKCSMNDVCPKVWQGYSEIYGLEELTPICK